MRFSISFAYPGGVKILIADLGLTAGVDLLSDRCLLSGGLNTPYGVEGFVKGALLTLVWN